MQVGAAVAGQRGSATVEVAVALPVVVVVLTLMIAVVQVGVQRVGIERAAAVAARQAALGDKDGAAQLVARIAGDEARASISESNGWVSVEVSRSVPGPWRGLAMSARQSAPTEAHLVGVSL
ncbi:hypothetical protein FB389_1084 [Rarobacter incanus]|uniref:TadE-like protein n=1 Tax=Rarobacter incanus TaxID=153494 RepID=A0A542SP69_9MICO|nr:hypothetical protein FB389_1084 [Rarobacter incanus]